jgi:hypothetical protein
MATEPITPVSTTEPVTSIDSYAKPVEPSHDYHAEAHVLSGDLQQPVKQPIQRHALVVLKDRRGGHFTQTAEDFSLEGLITFKSGRTRVSGSPSLKASKGWVTLSSSILEGMNIFEVITADRVVGQVSTDHPRIDGHVPHVTFLGTHFENFRIGGFPVEIELDLSICGTKPDGDRPYKSDNDFLDRVIKQCASIANKPGVPEELKTKCEEELAYIDRLRERYDTGNSEASGNGNSNGKRPSDSPIRCSLVKSFGKLPPGVTAFGNVLSIPGFGLASIAEVEVGTESDEEHPNNEKYDSNYFTLKMVNMQLGCIGHGTAVAGALTINGKTKP